MRHILLLVVLITGLSGCAPQLRMAQAPSLPPAAGEPDGIPQTGRRGHAPMQHGLPALHVTTDDNSSLLFHRDTWQLTVSGIRGTADVYPAGGGYFTADTTLSYWETASASPAGRSSTMSQFMLTILGVILVLGLAAVILYAAFLATKR